MVASEEEKERHRNRLRKRNKVHREMMDADSPFRYKRVVPDKRGRRKGNKGNWRKEVLSE